MSYLNKNMLLQSIYKKLHGSRMEVLLTYQFPTEIIEETIYGYILIEFINYSYIYYNSNWLYKMAQMAEFFLTNMMLYMVLFHSYIVFEMKIKICFLLFYSCGNNLN